MTRYTPKPWSVMWWATDDDHEKLKSLGMQPLRMLTNEGQVPILAADKEGGRKRIAVVDCHARYKRGHGHKAECEERDANARLIGAAPWLDEAARAALAGQRPEDGGPLGVEMIAIPKRAYEALREAVAFVDGEKELPSA